MTASELQAFLKRHGMPYAKLAEIIGVTDIAVYHWISGKRAVARPMARLIRLFDTNPDLMDQFYHMKDAQ